MANITIVHTSKSMIANRHFLAYLFSVTIEVAPRGFLQGLTKKMDCCAPMPVGGRVVLVVDASERPRDGRSTKSRTPRVRFTAAGFISGESTSSTLRLPFLRRNCASRSLLNGRLVQPSVRIAFTNSIPD